MPDSDQNREAELRKLFADADAPNALNVQSIIARSRARRLPFQLGIGAISALAVAGIVVVAVQPSLVTSGSGVSVVSEGSAADSSVPQTPMGGQKRAPADRINLCSGPVADVSPSFYGLQLDVQFPQTASAGSDAIDGTVRLTNTSSTQVVGYTAATPAITLSQNGVVLWHSNGVMIMSAVMVDLQPGESLEYPASFTPVSCTVDDDLAESFRADLPPVPAGSYEVSALIDFNADGSMAQQDTPELDLVSGPSSTITLQ